MDCSSTYLQKIAFYNQYIVADELYYKVGYFNVCKFLSKSIKCLQHMRSCVLASNSVYGLDYPRAFVSLLDFPCEIDENHGSKLGSS